MHEYSLGLFPSQCSRLEDSYKNQRFRSQHSGFVREPVLFNCTNELPSKNRDFVIVLASEKNYKIYPESVIIS